MSSMVEKLILKPGALQRLVQLNGSVFAQPLPGLAKDHPMSVVSKVTLRIVQGNPRPIARVVLLQPLQDFPFPYVHPRWPVCRIRGRNPHDAGRNIRRKEGA